MSGAVTLKRGQRAKAKPVKRVAYKPVAPLVRLPFSAARLRRHLAMVFVPLALTAAVVTLILLGIPQAWWQSVAHAAGRAGFEVRHVEVSGVKLAPKLPIYAAALTGPTNSMLLVDLGEIRDRLRALPWVDDASVTRRLPDTLQVQISERRPIALWQYQHRLAAIDRTGKPLTSDRLDRFAQLPMVIGAGANLRAHDVLVLLANQPGIAGQVDAATLVGNRRWDLRFKSGETLALPEGDVAATKALASFAQLNRKDGLLDKGFARFDMRLPGKMTVRVRAEVKPVAAPKEVKA